MTSDPGGLEGEESQLKSVFKYRPLAISPLLHQCDKKTIIFGLTTVGPGNCRFEKKTARSSHMPPGQQTVDNFELGSWSDSNCQPRNVLSKKAALEETVVEAANIMASTGDTIEGVLGTE